MQARSLVGAVVLVVLVAACGTTDDWSQPHTAPSPVGSLGPGFVSSPPTPEATISPAPGSWDGVHPSPGYRVVLLTSGDEPSTTTLATAVRQWAGQEQVSLRTVTSDGPGQELASIGRAVDLRPDLVICAGNALVDPLTLVTADHLDQQFLVLGAELAEPTANVTAANWPGASYRGADLATSSGEDPTSYTPQRAAAAVRAGVAGVLNGLTGIVIRLR